MGKPMALNLRKAGFPLVVHSRSRGPVDELVASGATAAATPRDVAKAVDVVITMLPDTPDVERVIRGADGVLEGLRTGSVVIDMSSISPDATRRLAQDIANRGSAMIDAPVSGGEIGAKNATLSIMCGGDEHVFATVRPVLEALGAADRIIRIGPSGAGQVCKICNQMAIGGALAGVSEAFAIARAAGIDAALVRQALLGGFAASRVLEVHGERLLTGQFTPGFRTALYQKDLRLAAETARSLNVRTGATREVSALVDDLTNAGAGHFDYAAIGTMVAGVPVVACGEVRALEVATITIDDARDAFRWAQPIVFRQAWQAAPDAAFEPAVVRLGWRGNQFYVFADLTDADVTSAATSDGQRFWELGDTFEIFLRAEGAASYIECHVTPDNFRLELAFPEGGPEARASATGSAAGSFESARRDPGFQSRTWQRDAMTSSWPLKRSSTLRKSKSIRPRRANTSSPSCSAVRVKKSSSTQKMTSASMRFTCGLNRRSPADCT